MTEPKEESAQKCSEGNTRTSEPKYRSRGWCFNCPFDHDPLWDDRMRYMRYQEETGLETGYHHWQGYVYFNNPVTLFGAQKLVFGKSFKYHIEAQRGTYEQAIDYCFKEETRGRMSFEHGTRPSQGNRGDLVEMKDSILLGKRLDDIVIDDPVAYHQYGRALEKIQNIVDQRKTRSEDAEIIVYYGDSGTGKSHRARKMCPEAYEKSDNSKWWPGYQGQKTVIFHEFDNNEDYKFDLTAFKNMADLRNMQVQTKGGYVPFLAEKIIICSNHKPSEWYTFKNDRDQKAFNRRLSQIHAFEGEDWRSVKITREK